MKAIDGEKYTETLHRLYQDYNTKDLEFIVARYNAEFGRGVTVDEVSTLLP
jgi:predicted alpha/beta-fold hydrolase|tara:strand:+ start:643 stop:795 length:153 start_codon:yes stop_codon:yes gene_type:complete